MEGDHICILHLILWDYCASSGAGRKRKLETEDNRQKVRTELISAIPGLSEETYDSLLDQVLDVISHEDLVSISLFDHTKRDGVDGGLHISP